MHDNINKPTGRPPGLSSGWPSGRPQEIHRTGLVRNGLGRRRSLGRIWTHHGSPYNPPREHLVGTQCSISDSTVRATHRMRMPNLRHTQHPLSHLQRRSWNISLPNLFEMFHKTYTPETMCELYITLPIMISKRMRILQQYFFPQWRCPTGEGSVH